MIASVVVVAGRSLAGPAFALSGDIAHDTPTRSLVLSVHSLEQQCGGVQLSRSEQPDPVLVADVLCPCPVVGHVVQSLVGYRDRLGLPVGGPDGEVGPL